MPSDPYRDFTLEQLLLHPSFVAWSLQTDPESVLFWDHWLTENADCRPKLQQARLLSIALHERYQQPIEEIIIQENLRELQRQVEKSFARPLLRPWLRRHWTIAASLAGLLCLAIGAYWVARSPVPASLSAQDWVRQSGLSQTMAKKNVQSGLSTIVLSDGSTVTLEPGSQLIYPPTFEGPQRKVYLQGEAFFEVAKNAKQPFLVYTGASVVRVVGTSFRVKASGQSPDQVAVRTGRVLVYAYRDFARAGSNEHALAEKAIVLLPNEQVILDPERQSQKIPVGQATDAAAILTPQELVYDDRPVTEVMQHIASLYGVELQYDPATLARCRITASFREESLEERLRSICAAISADFKMQNGKIVISGHPCR